LEYLVAGTEKSYLWKEMKSSNGSVLGILIPDLHIMRDLMYLLCFRAKLSSIANDIKDAAKDIVAVYHLGNHLTGRKTLVEQVVGVSSQGYAVKTALMIIDNIKPSRKDREFLYDSLLKNTSKSVFEPDLLVIKFTILDCLQRSYIVDDNIRKQGEQEFRRQLASLNLSGTGLFMISGAFVGKYHKFKSVKMDYQKAEELLLKGFEELEQVVLEDAWQLNKIMADKNNKLQNIQELHPFLNTTALTAVNIKISSHEQLRAQIRGLDVIMAVLEYQENTGKLPDNLDKLQEAGLIREIPVDPFSGKPVKYKKLDGSFTVYSYGLDFDDDGGRKIPNGFMPNSQDGDLVIWPVEKSITDGLS
jgi:hypothetical protein